VKRKKDHVDHVLSHILQAIVMDVPVFLCVHTVALQWIEEVFTVLAAQTAQVIHSSILTISGMISWMVFDLSEDIIMNSLIVPTFKVLQEDFSILYGKCP
jgi:hypothetical protein